MSKCISTIHRVYLLSGTIFFMVAILHLSRLVFHWPMVLGPLRAPYWFSYTGFPVALAYSMWAGWLYWKLSPKRANGECSSHRAEYEAYPDSHTGQNLHSSGVDHEVQV